MGWPEMLLRVAELAAVVLLAKWARNQMQPRPSCNCGCHNDEEEETT